MTIDLQQSMYEAIEKELQRQIAKLDGSRTKQFHEMLTYHMGWTGEGAGLKAAGKRIRPLLVLLTTASVMEEMIERNTVNWLHAVSASASIELIHNFSLIHDDVQDNSDKRRGRPTVWAKWGVPMAINAGDALFVLANQAMLDLVKYYPTDIVAKAATILNNNCLELTNGQYLDMSYEKRNDLLIEDYWPMIGGKTSSLLSTCTHIGALLGYAKAETQEAFRLFGYHLGIAFQVQDDILGIWGDESATGKSAASDLVEGKNSLPVLFGLEQNLKFADRWHSGPVTNKDVDELAKTLMDEGAKEYAEKMSAEQTQKALSHLEDANPRGEAGEAIIDLTNKLLNRKQ